MTDHRPPTIADVARHAGVSIATVSRVLNGSTPVIDETAERVRVAIDELHYTPRHAARVLANRRTDTLGLLLPEIGGRFFSPLLRGIEAEARSAGYDLLIHATSHIPHASTPTPHRPLAEHNTDGLIVFAQSIDIQELERLYQIKFPVVMIYQTPPAHILVPTVVIENRAGAEALVSHLIETHNCRRIAFLRGPEGNEDSEGREAGYRQALEIHSIAYDPALTGFGGFNEEDAQATVQEWLNFGLDFDAIFAGDDDTATGALSALHLAGRRIPEEIRVVGFDDLPVTRFLTPPLTTVHVPIEEVGRSAVQKLVHLIRGEPADGVTLVPVELIIRQSCGCESGRTDSP